jgi:ubiquinol-cytochrome c reductase cytochrome b subunit
MKLLGAVYHWLDVRLGINKAILPVVKHPVPKTVNWWYVFGSATLVAFTVQVVTGVALAFTYIPSPNSATDSLRFITDQATLGRIVRGIHYWGASAMVVLIFVHMIRTFLFGSYKFPRELNWLTGVLLFALTLGMAFTGQTLRWEQNAYWSIVVAAEQAGRTPLIGDLLVRVVIAGETVSGATLTRFYATHVFLLPALMFIIIGVHLYLVVRHGISEPPKAGEPVEPATYQEHYEELLEKEGVPFWPDAAWRDVVFALAIGAIVVGLSIIFGPPDVGKTADPTVLLAYPRPDWYFLWYFAVLALIPPGLETAVIIGFPALIGLVLVALPFISNRGERSPRRRPWAIATVGVAVVGIAVLLGTGYRAPWSPEIDRPDLPPGVTAGLQGDALVGADLFKARACISCHAIEGAGGHRGPDLSNAGARLSPDQLTWRILNGGHNMPAYGNTISPDDLNALVAFLETRGGDQRAGR